MPNGTITYFQPLITEENKLSGDLVSYNTTQTVSGQLEECTEEIEKINNVWGDFTFSKDSWTLTPSAPSYYVQSINITGMLADYNPTMIPDYSSFTTRSGVTGMQEAISYIVEIETLAGSIKAKALTKPRADIIFKLVGR